jgi:hypothetical protein
MGAFLVVGRALKADISQALGLIVINLVLGFVIPGTDWRAHLGGLVTGILVAIPLAYAPKRGRAAVQITSVLVVLALLVGATVLRDQVLTTQMISDGLDLTSITG